MGDEHIGPAPEDASVQEAAEHAERAVQERREMARKATQADDPHRPGDDAELERESEEHGRAAHEQEVEAEQSAREADAGA